VDQLNQYYREISRGKIQISGEVLGWYTVDHPMSYYGHDSKKPGSDDNLRTLATDALALVPSSVNLTTFHYLVIVHAGKDQADDEPDVRSDEIWSSCHCAVFPDFATSRPVSVRSKSFANFAFLSEFDGVGTFAHEWGHLLGLPDLYDTDSGESYVGYWSLMDSGDRCCYNEKETTPSYIDSWGEALLGWLPISVGETAINVTSFTLNPLESSNASAVLIPVSASTYYLLEYRIPTGRDSQLPSSGILIYYVDEQLNSGKGILKLVNPMTATLFATQAAGKFNSAAFKIGDRFRDLAHEVYLAFVGNASAVTTLSSKQELAGDVASSVLRAALGSSTWTYGDSVRLNGTLLSEEGMPLAAQGVGIELFDPTTNQWELLRSEITGTHGEISFQFRIDFSVGDRKLRLLYGGGKIGSTWYTSSLTEFGVTIAPAEMTVAAALPWIAEVTKTTIQVTVTGIDGKPLARAVVTLFVDNVQRGVVETDSNGKASLDLHLGLAEIGSHTIIARVSAANYVTVEVAKNVYVIPPYWLIGTVMGIAIACLVILTVRRQQLSSSREKTQSTVFCTKCGAELPQDSMYCLQCGSKQPNR
jgi:M6 family metalloprotease-like protein